MTEKDIKVIELQVNSQQAVDNIENLKKKVEELEKEKADAYKEMNRVLQLPGEPPIDKAAAKKKFKAATKDLEKYNKQLFESQNLMDAVNTSLERMDKATPKQLRTTIQEINNELNSGRIERGSEQWKEYTQKLQEVKTELKKVNDEQKAFEEPKGFIENFRKMGERWIGAVTVVKEGINAISSAMMLMRAYVDEYAEMQEHMSGVVKYTGLSAEAVDELNESFKGLDTRTSRAQLNDLAADAGRLGIQSKEQVLDFVDAANQITVALGEDLGDDAVKNIGKITQLFQTDPSASLKEGMLATASTINDLAQSSSASEPYLLEFTARLSGMANSAKISQTDIFGLASVLDQSMVGVEKGATAMQNVLGALFRKPAQMAKIAGLNVKEFTSLLQNDANAALLQFLSALKDHGGMENVAPMLEDMKLSGSGVTQTLTALANNLDRVTAAQQQAAEAYKNGTSVSDEYNKANNTLQAQLEKAEGSFADLRIEVGQKLTPVYMAMLNGTVSLSKAVMAVTGFVMRHAVAFGYLAAVILVYNQRIAIATALQKANNLETLLSTAYQKGRAVVLGAVTAVQNLLSIGTAANTATVEANNAAWRMSPLGGIILLIGVLVLGYEVLTGTMKKQTDAQRRANHEAERQANLQKQVNDAKEEANRKTAEEMTKIDLLRRRVNDQTLSYQERNKALLELQKIVPDYHASLTKSGQLINNNTQAIDNYIKKLKDKAYAEALNEKLVEAYKKQQDAELLLQRKENNVNKVEKELRRNPERYKSTMVDVYMPSTMGAVATGAKTEGNKVRIDKQAELRTQQQSVTTARQGLADAKRDVDDLTRMVEDARKKGIYDPLNQDGTPYTRTTRPTKGSKKDPLLEKEQKEGAALEKKLDEEHKQRMEELRASYVAGQLSYEDYYKATRKTDLDILTQKRDFYQRDTKARDKWQKEIEQTNERAQKDDLRWSLEKVNRAEKDALALLEQQHARGLSTEREYQDAKNEIVLEALRNRLDYQKQWGNVDDIERAEHDYTAEQQRQQYDREKRYLEQVRALRAEYAKKTPAEQMKIEIDTLNELHRQKYIDEEEFQRLLKALRAKYTKEQRAEEERAQQATAEAGRKRLEDARTAVSGKTSNDGHKDGRSTMSSNDGISGAFVNLSSAALKMRQDARAYAHLKELREKDKEHAKEYDAALRLLDEERMANLTNLASAAYGSISALLSGLSAYTQAEGQAEEARISARYDQEIKAAEGNTEKQKTLEAKKQKELAKVKSEYARRAADMQVAQAVASGAMAAINAYASASAIPIVGTVLAPIAAATAVAATALQIATIRKQAEAQQQGYYEGGFTGGNRYRREAGVVHEGEFVANHKALQNPSVLRVLRIIDQAQRNNTIATLNLSPLRATAETSTRALLSQQAQRETTTSATAESLTPIMTPRSHEKESATQIKESSEAVLSRLADVLERGIRSTVSIDGQDGLAHQLQRFQDLQNRK